MFTIVITMSETGERLSHTVIQELQQLLFATVANLIFGFAVYLKAGLGRPGFSLYYIPALLFASFVLFSSRDLAQLPQF